MLWGLKVEEITDLKLKIDEFEMQQESLWRMKEAEFSAFPALYFSNGYSIASMSGT